MLLPPGGRVRGIIGARDGSVLFWGQSQVWSSRPGATTVEVCPLAREVARVVA